MPPFVVFSGVEALLNDQRAAKFDDAEPVVALLASRGVPLVLCSGRTRAELEYVQQGIGIADPFICEHGAAVFVRDGYFPADVPAVSRARVGYRVVEFGRRQPEIADILHRTASRVRVDLVSFSEMSIGEVAAACGLPPLQARLAKLRDYEEGFRIVDDDPGQRSRLRRALEHARIGCVADGAFDFAGAPVDLAAGARWLTTAFRDLAGPVASIGIADKAHHLPLLRSVDVPIVVHRGDEAGDDLAAAVPTAIVTRGPDGAALAERLAAVIDRTGHRVRAVS